MLTRSVRGMGARYDAGMSAEATTRTAIENLLKAIESRDLRRVRRALHPSARWQNIPHPAAEGREAVMVLLGGILCWSERVRWDLHHVSIEGANGSVERLDRFWLQGGEYAVACHGVFSVDIATRTVISVRDYVDLGEWRQRVNPMLTAMASRPGAAVVSAHLAAISTAAPLAIASHYALDAIIECPSGKITGWDAIADYCEGLVAGPGCHLIWGNVSSRGAEEVMVEWRLPAGEGTPQSGCDTYEVRDGRITKLVTTRHL